MQTLQVQQTTDYSIFNDLGGNRKVNKLHVSRIKESMEDKTLVSPILVNEKYEIIDGQHRFQALRELGKPVQFLQVKGYGLDEVQILNVNHKNWTTQSFLDSYVDLGYKDYVYFKEFFEAYEFPFMAALAIVHNQNDDGNIMRSFRSGEFKFTDIQGSYDRADRLKMIEPYFDKYTHINFVRVMLYMFKHQDFEFTVFMSKLRLQPTALQIQQTASQYKLMIEDIYNFKSRDKVSLRY